MPVVSYSLKGIPAKFLAAFTPTAALTAGASSHGIIKVYGSPGTTRMPSRRPSAIPDVGPDPATNPSAVAPDWWLPSIYVTDVRSVMNPQDARFSWMAPYTVTPPSTVEVMRVPDVAFNPYPGLPHGSAMTWPRTRMQTWGSITEPGVEV